MSLQENYEVMPHTSAQPSGRQVIMFDGVCTLCNRLVSFVIRKDPERVFLFASLQSDAARNLLEGSTLGNIDSLVLKTAEGVYTRSTAALKIAERLYPLRILAKLLLHVPTILRDPVYDLIARNRYKMFGKDDRCQWVSDYKDRFLS